MGQVVGPFFSPFSRTNPRWGKDEKVELRVFAGTWNLGNVEPTADLQVSWTGQLYT